MYRMTDEHIVNTHQAEAWNGNEGRHWPITSPATTVQTDAQVYAFEEAGFDVALRGCRAASELRRAGGHGRGTAGCGRGLPRV
jgi:hypothetical protein